MKNIDEKATRKDAKKDAKEMLLKFCKPGDTLYTVIRSVSKSGMSRNLDVFAIHEGRPLWLSVYIAACTGMRLTDGKGLHVTGCGMDMGFHVVNNLSIALFCPGKYTREGANALRQEWI